MHIVSALFTYRDLFKCLYGMKCSAASRQNRHLDKLLQVKDIIGLSAPQDIWQDAGQTEGCPDVNPPLFALTA